MPRDECLITPRLAGPCATCRQPAWPAHVRGFEVYCEACCGCGRGDAEAPGRDAAGPACDLAARGRHQGQAHGMPPARSGPAHRMPRARAPGLAIALERGGKARTLPRPLRANLGPFLALREASCSAIRAALPRPGRCARFRLPPACRTQAGAGDAAAPGLPPAGATTWPARTRCHAAGHDAAGLAGPARQACTDKFAPRTSRRNISASKCSGGTSSLTGGLND